MKNIDLALAIDWFSIKITGAGAVLAAITGNTFLMVLSGIGIASTIVYNAIRIYKEIKNNKP